jgi:K+-sensing histidine kinase KdpD
MSEIAPTGNAAKAPMNGIPRKQFVRGSEGEVHDPPAWRGYLWTVVLVSALTAMGAVWRDRLALPDLVMTYVLIIMVTASLWGRGPSLVAATLSVLTYDFFFIPPFDHALGDGARTPRGIRNGRLPRS